jgi:hypothetical protein
LDPSDAQRGFSGNLPTDLTHDPQKMRVVCFHASEQLQMSCKDEIGNR